LTTGLLEDLATAPDYAFGITGRSHAVCQHAPVFMIATLFRL